MSELVEEIEVKIRLKHCKAEPTSERLGGNLNLRQLMFDHYWPKLAGFFAQPDGRGGSFKLHGESIEVRWSNSTLIEVPEDTGGDN